MAKKTVAARTPRKRAAPASGTGQNTVLISWSGPRSRRVATVLNRRLPEIIQALTPWMSEHDIEAGELWAHAIDRNLGANDSGVLCLTPENLTAPWLLFEAGALSKNFGLARVRPYLIDLRPGDVTGPLSRFQSVGTSQADTRKLVESINRNMSTPLSETMLTSAFDRLWPELERDLAGAATRRDGDGNLSPPRDPNEMLEEVLEILRAQERRRTEYQSFLQQPLTVSPFSFTGINPSTIVSTTPPANVPVAAPTGTGRASLKDLVTTQMMDLLTGKSAVTLEDKVQGPTAPT